MTEIDDLAEKVSKLITLPTPEQIAEKIVMPKHVHIGDCPDCIKAIPKPETREIVKPHPDFADVKKWTTEHLENCPDCARILTGSGWLKLTSGTTSSSSSIRKESAPLV
mgnify:CR=1 FL=1